MKLLWNHICAFMKSIIQISRIELNMWFSLHTRLNTLTHTAVKCGAALRLLSSAQALNYKGGDRLRESERERKWGQKKMDNACKMQSNTSNITKHKQLPIDHWHDRMLISEWDDSKREELQLVSLSVCLSPSVLQDCRLQTCNTAPMQTHTHTHACAVPYRLNGDTAGCW